MNIVVCVKQVPDTWSEKKLSPADSTLDRDAADGVINEIDEYAIEEALKLQEAHGGEVTVISMGPVKSTESLRKALSMGAHKAVLVSDPALHGSCAVQTARALGAAVSRQPFDLVILGSESTDARMSVVPAMLAEVLGLPQVTFCRKLEVDATTVRAERVADYGYDKVEASLPAVVSVVEKINEPRYPSFKGIMAAKKKPLDTVGVADLGLPADQVGLAAATSQVVDFAARPPKAAGVKVKDEGDGGVKIAEFLAAQKII